MRKVTVLGSGNAFSTDARAHACFHLENAAGESMLLDCGATSLLQMNRLQMDPDSIDRVLITHFHGDHLAGLPFVLLHDQVIARRSRPLELLGPVGLRENVERLIQMMYPGFHFDFELRFVELYQGQPYQSGAFSISPLKIDHRPESLGYRITGPGGGSFAFSGDTRFTSSLEALYAGVDVGILEVSMEEQSPSGTAHVAFTELLEGRALLRAGRMFYSHLTDHLARMITDEETRFPGFGLPLSDGMEIHFFSQEIHSAGH